MLGLSLRFAALTIVAGGVCAPLVAQAGHYRLPIADFISGEESTQLLKAGVQTTLGLLERVGTPAQRQRLAEVSGLPAQRIEALAGQVDLLRIEGIGPSMVRLLLATGVRHAGALSTESTGALHARMVAANAAQRIAPVTPSERLVAAWVAAAGRLPRVIEGLP